MSLLDDDENDAADTPWTPEELARALFANAILHIQDDSARVLGDLPELSPNEDFDLVKDMQDNFTDLLNRLEDWEVGRTLAEALVENCDYFCMDIIHKHDPALADKVQIGVAMKDALEGVIEEKPLKKINRGEILNPDKDIDALQAECGAEDTEEDEDDEDLTIEIPASIDGDDLKRHLTQIESYFAYFIETKLIGEDANDKWCTRYSDEITARWVKDVAAILRDHADTPFSVFDPAQLPQIKDMPLPLRTKPQTQSSPAPKP